MNTEVNCLLHSSLPIKASGNYTTIYHFWWLEWDNLDADFPFLTHSDIQDDDHSPYNGIIPLLFQICFYTFPFFVAWPVHTYETILYRGKKKITRGWYWRIRKINYSFTWTSKEKAFHGSSDESTPTKMELCRFFSPGYVLRSNNFASHLTHRHLWYPLKQTVFSPLKQLLKFNMLLMWVFMWRFLFLRRPQLLL